MKRAVRRRGAMRDSEERGGVREGQVGPGERGEEREA